MNARSITPLRVLLVEDSEQDALLVLLALERGGFELAHRRVETALDFESALVRENWDAVISDYLMPGFTGLDALTIFRAAGLDVPFILVSGAIGEETAVKAMKTGAGDYVMKDELSRLAQVLDRELKESRLRSAHREAQRNLIESEERFRSLTALSSDWYWELDEDFRFTHISSESGLGTGGAIDSRIGKTRWELPYLDAVWTAHRATLKARQPFRDFELQPLSRDGKAVQPGEVVHIAISGEPRFAADGRFLGYRGVGKDITGRLARDEKLRRFRAAVDISGDAILLIDRQTLRYIDVNQTFCSLVGYSLEEVVRMTPMDIFSADRATLERDYDALIADSTSGAKTYRGFYRHRDGWVIPVETRRRALHTEAGWVIVATARDITSQQVSEAKILRLNRVYAVMSGINSAIVRIRERRDLFDEVCRIAVADGGYVVARVVEIAPGAGAGIAAASGPVQLKFQQLLDDYNNDPVHSQSAIAQVFRTGEAFISNNVAADLRIPDRAVLTQEANYALALLPILVGTRLSGVIVLHARDAGAFDDDELKLLLEMTGNVSFALDHFENVAKVSYLALYDPLTGLANRQLFQERLGEFLRLPRAEGSKVAVLVVDIERFRTINETLGREAGDELLRQFSARARRYMVDPSWLARIGADQFASIIPDAASEEAVRLLEQRMSEILGAPFTLGTEEVRLAVKVGVALFPDDGTDAGILLRNAEAALKKAKSTGERILFYARKMTDAIAGKLTLENQLRNALDNEEFVLHYQPKVNLETGLLTSAEALIRWNDPRTGLVPPGRFIPVLEETGLIFEVGRWALRRAIQEYLRWMDAGLPAVRIAVNVSPLQLRNRSFVDEIGKVTGIDPRAAAGLELEITESVIMEDVRSNIVTLQAVRAQGVTIAIDDFGTGFSSLSYLAKLPVDTLKIDRSFVVEMMAGPEGLALVSTVINLAHSLKLKVVAEGVETEEQSRLLHLLGCDEMQGFLFSRPAPAAEFEARFLALPAYA